MTMTLSLILLLIRVAAPASEGVREGVAGDSARGALRKVWDGVEVGVSRG